MRKILYSLLIFAGIVFVSSKVHAGYDNNNIIYFDLSSNIFTSVYDSLKPKLEQIQEVLSNNPKGHKYTIFIGKDTSGNEFIKLYLMASNANYQPSDMYCYMTSYYISNSYGTFPRNYAGCNSTLSYSPYNYGRYSYSSSDSSSFNTLITQLSNDILLGWSSSSFLGTRSTGDSYTTTNMVDFRFSNNTYNHFDSSVSFILPYASNVPIYNYHHYYEKTYTFYSLKIGDTELPYSAGSYLEPSDNYFDKDEPYKVKRSIEFNSGISSFDIYVDKDDELSDLTYKINYVDYNDYTTENITKSKLYTVMFYGLKNENGLYHWEMLDDCTNWDYPSEYCHVKSKFEQLESELNKEGFTVEGYVDFLDIFNEYDTVRVVLRLDNALTGKIDYWDKNMKIAATDVDVNYFGFDYSRNLSDSDLYRYTIFSTKEQDLSGNLYIISQSNDITINYFDTKYANFKEYSSLADVKKQENFWLFNYEHIGLNNNLGFYLFTDRNLTERLVYQFYTNTGLYFSYNDSDTLDDTIYIDNTGNSTNGNIAIDPDELMNYEYETIDDLFENITKFNEKINVVSQEIHKVIQYAYDSLNIYIKSFLISIFTVILVSGTIVLIRR